MHAAICRVVCPAVFISLPSFLVPEITNGRLNDGSTYRFLTRGLDYQRKAIEPGTWTPPIDTVEKIDPPSPVVPVGLIVGVVVTVILVVVIVSAVLLYFRRRNIGGREKPLGKYVEYVFQSQISLDSSITFLDKLCKNGTAHHIYTNT